MVYGRAVTEIDEKATRRAQRREKQQTPNDAAEGTSELSSQGEQSEAGDSVSESQPAPKRTEQIRDRNARLRAQAAEERRAKREREKATVAIPVGLDASERMDDIFVRSTHAAAGWLRQNFKWLQWVVIGGVALGIGTQAYRYVSKNKAARSTDAFAVGLQAETGTVRPADDAKSVNPELEQLDPRPVYDSAAARLAAAEQGYRKAMETHAKTGAAMLARLGLAGVLYDEQRWDEALEHYRAVRASELAKTDPDILGRSLEGIGLALEGKGDLEGALQAFRELTNQEGAPSLATLGLYHQGRVLAAQGQKDKAKEVLAKAKERLDKANQSESGKEDEARSRRPGYVAESVKMLLAKLDPASAKSASARSIGDALRDDPAKLQRMLQDLQNSPTAPSAPSGGQ